MFWVVLAAVNVDVGLSGQPNENKTPFFWVPLLFLIKRARGGNVAHTLANQNLCENISGVPLSLPFLLEFQNIHLNFKSLWRERNEI